LPGTSLVALGLNRRFMKPDRFQVERELVQSGLTELAGVDEAGRGPLAGPVVAAAVMLPIDWVRGGIPDEFRGLNDSKQLSAAQRDRFFESLNTHPEVRCGLAVVDHWVIDSINILKATHRAMKEALAALGCPVGHALVDGNPVPTLDWPQTALVQGDSRSYSIAAASVLAKVTRDRWMLDADTKWPAYGFAQHKGYPTRAHLAALLKHGPCPIHRRSFAPLRPTDPELFPA
jgi:ribonuclease HII